MPIFCQTRIEVLVVSGSHGVYARVLDKRKIHKLVLPPKTVRRVNVFISLDSREKTQERVGEVNGPRNEEIR